MGFKIKKRMSAAAAAAMLVAHMPLAATAQQSSNRNAKPVPYYVVYRGFTGSVTTCLQGLNSILVENPNQGLAIMLAMDPKNKSALLVGLPTKEEPQAKVLAVISNIFGARPSALSMTENIFSADALSTAQLFQQTCINLAASTRILAPKENLPKENCQLFGMTKVDFEARIKAKLGNDSEKKEKLQKGLQDLTAQLTQPLPLPQMETIPPTEENPPMPLHAAFEEMYQTSFKKCGFTPGGTK